MLVHHLLQNGRDDIAVIDRGNRFSYKTLRILTDRFRNYLYAQGVRRGDRVGIFSRKTVHYITAYMAIASLGAIAVPINVQLSQREVAYMLRDAGCSYLLTNKIFDWPNIPVPAIWKERSISSTSTPMSKRMSLQLRPSQMTSPIPSRTSSSIRPARRVNQRAPSCRTTT